jgi:predicted MFS family arabinose efflux permease
MAKLIGLMLLLYGIQAACSNPGLAYLPLVAYLTDTLGFSAAQLASFQAVALLPWFSKPLWGLLADGVPLLGYRLKGYLVLCYSLIIVCFIGLGTWANPSVAVLLSVVLAISTGVAFSDVLADRLMVVEGQKRQRANLLQAAQWTGLGFTAIAMYGLGGWLADRASLSTAFFLSTIMPGVGLVVACTLREKPNATFTLGQSWRSFWQAATQPQLRQLVGLIALIRISPLPVDYIYQRQVLDFDNILIGHLKAVEFLGLGLGAITFGLLTRYGPRVSLLGLAIAAGALATLSLAFMHDAPSAYGVYLVRGFMAALSMLGLLGLVVQRCPQQAEGFTYALMVSISNLAMSLGLVMGGQLYDWGLSFAGVAVIGAGYLVVCGGAVLWGKRAQIDT